MITPRCVTVSLPPGVVAQYSEFNTSLPTDADFFVVQFVRLVSAPDLVLVTRGGRLRIPLAALDLSGVYKLIAFKVSNGFADGVWWHDNYVYSASQLNIEFTSQGQSSGSGDAKSFSGRTTVNKSPVSRTVIAVGIDGSAPVFLAQTQSDQAGRYTLEWQGYSGNILITALDDYGVAFNEGDPRGAGERIHPAAPNGYVYQVSTAGILGAEPNWPTAEGAQVICGSCILVTLPFYRPKSTGPVFID